MPLVQLTNPSTLPITFDEARRHLRIYDNEHEETIYELMQRATHYIETILGAALSSRTYRLDIDGFPINTGEVGSDYIDLGIYPVTSIDSVVYDNSSNTETSLTLTTDYWQLLSGKYPKIAPVTSWPATYSGKIGAVRISFTAGYTQTDDIPGDVKHAILMQLKQYFDYGNDWILGTHATPTNAINQMLFQHKRLHL